MYFNLMPGPGKSSFEFTEEEIKLESIAIPLTSVASIHKFWDIETHMRIRQQCLDYYLKTDRAFWLDMFVKAGKALEFEIAWCTDLSLYQESSIDE